MGLGTMTVVHATEGVEGSQQVLPGMFAGGFDSLVQMARQVSYLIFFSLILVSSPSRKSHGKYGVSSRYELGHARGAFSMLHVVLSVVAWL